MHKPYLVAVLFLSVIVLNSLNVMTMVSAITSSIVIPLTVDHTSVMASDLPFPLQEYKILLEIRLVAETNIPVDYTVNKDTVLPGESVSVSLASTICQLRSVFFFTIIITKGNQVILYKSISSDISIIIPGTLDTPSIPLPIIPFEIFGIPAELYLSFGLRVTSEVVLKIMAEGLQPSQRDVSFTQHSLFESIQLDKKDGVGARISICQVGLCLVGKLTTGIGISLLYFLTPLKLDLTNLFPSLNIVEFSPTLSSLDHQLAILKTPVQVNLDVPVKDIRLGQTLTISGRIAPTAVGLEINLLARKVGQDWSIVASALTSTDGSFVLYWTPTAPNKYEVKAFHSKTMYTFDSSSIPYSVSVSYVVVVKIAGLPANVYSNIYLDGVKIGYLSTDISSEHSIDDELTHTISIDEYVQGTVDIRYFCPSSSWSFSSGGSKTFMYEIQYYLTVSSLYVDTYGTGWYDDGASATFSISTLQIDHGNWTRHSFTGWDEDLTASTPSVSVIMNSPMNVVALWKTEYYMEVESKYGNPEGAGWYDAGTVAHISVESSVPTKDLMGSLGARQIFVGWTGDLDSSKPSTTIVMSGPKRVIAAWRADYTVPYVIIGASILFVTVLIILFLRRRKAPTISTTLSIY